MIVFMKLIKKCAPDICIVFWNMAHSFCILFIFIVLSVSAEGVKVSGGREKN